VTSICQIGYSGQAIISIGYGIHDCSGIIGQVKRLCLDRFVNRSRQ